MKSKLLMDQPPLQLQPGLAVALGLSEAIVIQQIHYWIRYYQQRRHHKEHYHDGRWWVWNSTRQWCEDNFPFWSERTVRRIIKALREPFEPKVDEYGSLLDERPARGPLLLTGQYNKRGYDKTLWYTIDYDELDRVLTYVEDKMAERYGQDGQVDTDKMAAPIPETTIRLPKTTPRVSEKEPKPKGYFDLVFETMKHRKKDEPITHLAEVAASLLGLPLEALDYKFEANWFDPMASLLRVAGNDLDKAERALRQANLKAQEGDLTVTTAKSLYNLAVKELAKPASEWATRDVYEGIPKL